jgi:hypothetical protein
LIVVLHCVLTSSENKSALFYLSVWTDGREGENAKLEYYRLQIVCYHLRRKLSKLVEMKNKIFMKKYISLQHQKHTAVWSLKPILSLLLVHSSLASSLDRAAEKCLMFSLRLPSGFFKELWIDLKTGRGFLVSGFVSMSEVFGSGEWEGLEAGAVADDETAALWEKVADMDARLGVDLVWCTDDAGVAALQARDLLR